MAPGYISVAALRKVLGSPLLKDDDLVAPNSNGDMVVYREGLGMWLDLLVIKLREVEG